MSGGAERRGRQREESLTTAPSITPAPTARAATFWTGLLCVLLTGAAVVDLVLTRNSTWHLLDAALSPPLFVVAMAGLFALTELALVHIEFRHEAYSISLAGIPLVLGALTGSATDLVLARVVGGQMGVANHRPPPQNAQ
jgi:hypothetical protein